MWFFCNKTSMIKLNMSMKSMWPLSIIDTTPLILNFLIYLIKVQTKHLPKPATVWGLKISLFVNNGHSS